MKPALINNRATFLRLLAPLILCAAVAVTLGGCATAHSGGTAYRPANVYHKAAYLPRELKRVAVLSIANRISSESLEEGAEALDPILLAELAKTERFEIIPVSADQLRQWTGQPSWYAGDSLPPGFLAQIQSQTGCDAVLFCELTHYSAYKPVAVGWKFTLVESPAGNAAPNILWCSDSIIDAGDPDIARAARTYQSQHIGNEWHETDRSMILGSPRRFGQFTLCAVFGTLPERKNR